MAQAELAEMPTENTPVELGTTKAAITRLRKKFPADQVPDCTTKDGMAACKSVLKELTPIRTGIEGRRKELVAGAVAWQKKVNAEARELTDAIKEIEDPYRTAKEDEDERQRKAKREAEEAEERRIAEIEAKVEGIRLLTEGLLGADLETLEARQAEALAIKITDEEYMEFVEPASVVLGQAKQSLAQAVEMARANAAQQREIDEHKREAKLNDSIQRIRMAPVDLIGATVADIQASLDKLTAIDVSEYGDKADTATVAITETTAKLEAMIEQQRVIEDQQSEIDQQKEDQARRDREAEEERQRKEREEREAEEKAQRDAELKARLPEDQKLREYAEALVSIPAPDVESPEMVAVLREASLELSNIRDYIMNNTQAA